MEKVIITLESNGWKVQQGEKYADALCYEEMLAVLISLTLPGQRPYWHWRRTKEQHEAYMRAIFNINHQK